MAKIVYNNCFGGFSLSPRAVRRGKELSSHSDWQAVDEKYGKFKGPRYDPVLVQVVEELGTDANGFVASLAIVELPPGTAYLINEYDGLETVVTKRDLKWQRAP